MKKIDDYQMECINGGRNAAEEHNLCMLIGFGVFLVSAVCVVVPVAAPFAIAAEIGLVSSTVSYYASVLSC